MWSVRPSIETRVALFFMVLGKRLDALEGVRWNRELCQYLVVPPQHHRNTKSYWSNFAVRLRNSTTRWAKGELSVFVRTSVCNTFLVAKLRDVLQVLPSARTNIQIFHRIFSLFIWNWIFESMKRDNLFESVKAGVLGPTHLFLSEIVFRFILFRDQENPFIRTVIQTQLADFMPGFIASSYENVSTRLFVYLKVPDSVAFLDVRSSKDYLSGVNRRCLLKYLRAMLLQVPLYRQHFSDGPGQDVLECRVKRMCVLPRVKSFFSPLHSGTLPVKTWMNDKSILVVWSVECHICKLPVSADHVFISCWDVVFFFLGEGGGMSSKERSKKISSLAP